jgi:hypothetical protein
MQRAVGDDGTCEVVNSGGAEESNTEGGAEARRKTDE